jgi:hypothetical protein
MSYPAVDPGRIRLHAFILQEATEILLTQVFRDHDAVQSQESIPTSHIP